MCDYTQKLQITKAECLYQVFNYAKGESSGCAYMESENHAFGESFR